MSACLMEAPPTLSYRRYEVLDYPDDMAVTKVSVSLDAELLTAARAAAAKAGLSLSAWLNQIVEHRVRIERGLAGIREYEAENGPISDEDLRRADEVLDNLGVGR